MGVAAVLLGLYACMIHLGGIAFRKDTMNRAEEHMQGNLKFELNAWIPPNRAQKEG